MSGELVNLRRARKAKVRAAHETAGAANRAKHGRSSGEREATRRESEIAARRLDGHHRDDSLNPTDGNAA